MSGGRDWTTADARQLREWYPRIGAQACADMLGRSLQSVYQKARELGVSEKDRRRAQRFRPDCARAA